jgi:hypothetical protein
MILLGLLNPLFVAIFSFYFLFLDFAIALPGTRTVALKTIVIQQYIVK